MVNTPPTGTSGSVIQSPDEERFSLTCNSYPSNGALAEMIKLFVERVMRRMSFWTTRVTATEKAVWSLRAGEPLSVTRIMIRLVLGACAAVGVQVNRPVLGLMLAPAGPVTKLNVSVSRGESGSV